MRSVKQFRLALEAVDITDAHMFPVSTKNQSVIGLEPDDNLERLRRGSLDPNPNPHKDVCPVDSSFTRSSPNKPAEVEASDRTFFFKLLKSLMDWKASSSLSVSAA